MKWIKYESEDCYAIVICSYKPINAYHMDIQIGDFLFIKEQYPGWYRGFKYSEPCVLKVFPNTHVKLLSSEIHPDLWAEIFSWIPNIRETYLLTDNKEFDQVCEAIQLSMTEKRFDCLLEKSKITETNRRSLLSGIEFARKMLGLPIEPLNERVEKVNLRLASYLDLYSQHNKLVDNNRNISGQFDSAADSLSIFVKMLNIDFDKSINVDENLDVVVALYRLEDKVRISRLSESYTYRVTVDMNQSNLTKTIAIITRDIQLVPNHKIFVVFQLVRIGQMLPNKKNKSPNNKSETKFRRPFGVAVLDITGLITDTQDITNQVGIQLMQKEEAIESLTERLIVEYKNNKVDSRSAINIQFKAIRPDEYSDRCVILYGMNPYYPPPIRSKRNCLYLNLGKADIDRGGKKSDPNFEIDISIRDEMGNPVCMPKDDWRGIGNYKSMIYYHVGKPRWNELICIPLFDKLDSFPPQTHIRFMIWHRSLNHHGKIPYGVAFLKLFPKSNSYAIISNKEHEKFHVIAIHKQLDVDQIKTAKYLRFAEEMDGSMESLTISHSSSGSTIVDKVRTIGRKKKFSYMKDTLSVQTLLISNEYTFDELLSNICSNKPIDKSIMNNLCFHEIVSRNIDVDEIKKFAIKILESGLELLQKADESNLLGRNILIMLGEMFKAIKNLPDYQAQINKFIDETMHFKVHKQILHELINHVPEIDSNILRASDWFMKIIVKSYQNSEMEYMETAHDTIIFNDMVDRYLQKLECWANGKENKILRSIVLSKAGPIINALIPVCRPIGMANLVNNLLETSRDLDAITKAGLTMDCMHSRLFLDPDCRKIILPETTRNILELFHTQLNRLYHGREIDQDHMLDNICDKMVEFMQLHESNWQRANPETRDNLVIELLIDHNMLRSCVGIVSLGLDFLQRGDATYKLLYKPLMVLVTVIITSLSFMSDKLWARVVSEQIGNCNYCGSKQMTENYDMTMELLSLIQLLQMYPVFPDCKKACGEIRRSSICHKEIGIPSEVTPRYSKIKKQPWLDMLFVQNRQFLTTIEQIHKIIIKPFYLNNIIYIKRTKQGRLCCCHPSDKLQGNLINGCVENIELIISQSFLKLEELPPSSALRIMENSKIWDSDIRLYGALQIKEIWHDLEILKLFFSPFFFYIFSKLTTIHNYKIRLLAVECMFDIVHLDPEKKKTELITHIDRAMETADGNYCEEMSNALREVLSDNCLQYNEDSRLVEDIMIQMNNIQECSHHLNDDSPINGMIVINNLRKFYQKMGRSDIIGRYLFKLIDLHLTIKNFTEVGYTLLELSSFYRWSHESVVDTFFPVDFIQCEFHWQLKAQLLEESLKFFDLEDWEQGIEVCKELANGYTNFLVDFVKLSNVYKKMSEFFHRIMFDNRPESSAYIIFYYGIGFPKFIAELPHKSIVLVTKRNSAEVCMDLNSQFKNTTVERKFPNDCDENCADKRIFFMPIKACNFEIPLKYKGKVIKQRILKYYENYKIDEFIFKRLLNPTQEDPKKRKIDGCIIQCDGKLPSILSVVPVTSLRRESIDPFNEALYDLQNQIKKDTMLYQDYEMVSQEKRETMYQKMKEVMLKYISPVSGGLSKFVEMIPENDENKLSFAGDVFSEVFSLIFLYLQRFEIYDNFDSYELFLSEFRKILEAVSVRLDIFEEDFNINSLLEQFNRSRKSLESSTTTRKVSVINRVRHDDDGSVTNTLGRKTKIPKEMLGDMVSIGRNSGIVNEEHFHTVTTRTRIDIGEPALPPKRKSTSDIPTASVPPIPPKPKSNQRIASSFDPVTNFERSPICRMIAPKPNMSFAKDIKPNTLRVPPPVPVNEEEISNSMDEMRVTSANVLEDGLLSYDSSPRPSSLPANSEDISASIEEFPLSVTTHDEIFFDKLSANDIAVNNPGSSNGNDESLIYASVYDPSFFDEISSIVSQRISKPICQFCLNEDQCLESCSDINNDCTHFDDSQ